MASGVVTEVIWHFAGYLKIFDDIARDRIEYIDPALRNSSDDYTTPRPDYDINVTPDDIETRGVPMPRLAAFDELKWLHGIATDLPHEMSLPEIDFFPPRLSPSIVLPIPAIGGGSSGDGDVNFRISVEYNSDSEQSQIDIKQYNILFDNDSLLPENLEFPAGALTLRLELRHHVRCRSIG